MKNAVSEKNVSGIIQGLQSECLHKLNLQGGDIVSKPSNTNKVKNEIIADLTRTVFIGSQCSFEVFKNKWTQVQSTHYGQGDMSGGINDFYIYPLINQRSELFDSPINCTLVHFAYLDCNNQLKGLAFTFNPYVKSNQKLDQWLFSVLENPTAPFDQRKQTLYFHNFPVDKKAQLTQANMQRELIMENLVKTINSPDIATIAKALINANGSINQLFIEAYQNRKIANKSLCANEISERYDSILTTRNKIKNLLLSYLSNSGGICAGIGLLHSFSLTNKKRQIASDILQKLQKNITLSALKECIIKNQTEVETFRKKNCNYGHGKGRFEFCLQDILKEIESLQNNSRSFSL